MKDLLQGGLSNLSQPFQLVGRFFANSKVVSVQIGYLVGALVVIETLFNYPGIGKLMYDSAQGHDIPMLEATMLMVAIIYMVSNLLADVLLAVLNPRIRLAE